MQTNAAAVADAPISAGAGAHNVGRVDRIPLGAGRTFRLGGGEVAVFRDREGAVYAVQAACPHRGGTLADWLVGLGKVLCPHGQAFDLATGAPIRHASGPLRTYGVSVNVRGELLISPAI